jgi:predicted component of viral defense system (DUF524 family)
MTTLFIIETDRVVLTWKKARRGDPVPISMLKPPPGRLEVRPRRDGLQFGQETWRDGVPEAVAHDPEELTGPRIYEQTDYKIFLQSKSEAAVSIAHRDPLAYRDLSAENCGRVVHGYVNFGSEVGRSIFSILVDNQAEFDFEIEVFPTKIDYRSDYKQLLAEVQEILTGLALEYLQSTFQFGFRVEVPQPSHIEWLTLLRHVADDLERALQQIARRPVRELTREPTTVRAEQIKGVDSSVRSAVRRGAGSGRRIELGDGLAVCERLPAHQPRQTLDTPEHRWLRIQLDRIGRRLGRLRLIEQDRRQSDRRTRVLRELDGLKARVARLRRLEPIAAAEGTPSSGFASLQLMAAPGYHEAYVACLILSLGLRIEGGPLRLSAKRISLLYEYWCYLALLRLVSEVTGAKAGAEELFSIRQQGLHVLLEKGRKTTVPFKTTAGRKVSVCYNPLFSNDSYLISQKPDLLITFGDDHWRPLHLLLDAKYRVEGAPEYTERYGTPGPPEDAINVLHRYRDAILESEQAEQGNRDLRHTVVQAAAAFPYREKTAGEFRDGKLWQALKEIGVGAVPLLPDHVEYLRGWIRSCLRHGGWALADQAIGHRGCEQARGWRAAASEPVLVGVLRRDHQRQHLDWILEHKLYYLPRYPTQQLQYLAKWVAIYSPALLRDPGAVTHYASVQGVDVVARREISTPWPSHGGDPDQLCVVYELGEVRELDHPIENPGPDQPGQRFSSHRWTSRLALERARSVSELTLETEPEWRLYEDLRASNTAYDLQPGRPAAIDPREPAGRTWIIIEDGPRVRYAGACGFLVRHASGKQSYVSRVEQVLEAVQGLTGR